MSHTANPEGIARYLINEMANPDCRMPEYIFYRDAFMRLMTIWKERHVEMPDEFHGYYTTFIEEYRHFK